MCNVVFPKIACSSDTSTEPWWLKTLDSTSLGDMHRPVAIQQTAVRHALVFRGIGTLQFQGTEDCAVQCTDHRAVKSLSVECTCKALISICKKNTQISKCQSSFNIYELGLERINAMCVALPAKHVTRQSLLDCWWWIIAERRKGFTRWRMILELANTHTV